jgi:hypothetical protein
VSESKKTLLTNVSTRCNVSYMKTHETPITDALRRAINESGIPFLTLENETGVLRQSLMKFARGECTIHLDSADALAKYFGLELGWSEARAAKPKQKGK